MSVFPMAEVQQLAVSIISSPVPVPHEKMYGRTSRQIKLRHATSRHFIQRNQLSMGCIAASRQQVLINPKNYVRHAVSMHQNKTP